jgi:hypothetical protein
MLVSGVTCNVVAVDRMKTHAAPAGSSSGPPTMAVLASADSPTEKP